tara:strand:+ start:902 stop:1957 length:1056 start_codon:yes stop_codon:yes gene_type:complete
MAADCIARALHALRRRTKLLETRPAVERDFRNHKFFRNSILLLVKTIYIFRLKKMRSVRAPKPGVLFAWPRDVERRGERLRRSISMRVASPVSPSPNLAPTFPHSHHALVAKHDDGRIKQFASSVAAAKELKIRPTTVKASAQSLVPKAVYGWVFEQEGKKNKVAQDERWVTDTDKSIRISSCGRVQTQLNNGSFSEAYRPEIYDKRSPRVLGKRFAEMVFVHFCSPTEMEMRGIRNRTLRVVPEDGDWSNLAADNLICKRHNPVQNTTSFKPGVRRKNHGKPKQSVISVRDGQRRIHISQCHCARDMTEILTELKAEGKFLGNPVCNQGGVRKCVTGKMKSYKGFEVSLA